jgi:hypothetical protein
MTRLLWPTLGRLARAARYVATTSVLVGKWKQRIEDID